MRHLLLLLLLAGAAGGVALHHYRQQNRLHQQLAQLAEVLTAENDIASQNVQGTIKGIEAEVIKNRDLPANVALLRRAEALQAYVEQLVATLRTDADQLRRATGNKKNRPLQYLGTPISAELGRGAPRGRALRQHLAGYADTLRQLDLLEARSAPLQAPTFEDTLPVAEALADLARLESEVLTHQAHALRHLSARISVQRWLAHPLIAASAQSNAVAPGTTYRAQLGLVGYFSANQLKMHLACNGRPVPVGPAGTGLVCFRAPARPGPATWTGTIRLTQNGRDTTFRVTVPYRVARH